MIAAEASRSLRSRVGRLSASSSGQGPGYSMKMKPFPVKSLFLAPLSSIPAVTLAGLGSSDASIGSEVGAGLLFSVILAVPMSFAGLVLVGLPLFVLLRRHDTLLLVATCVAGCGLPYALLLDAPTRTALCGVAAGFAVSLTAYLLRPVVPNHALDDRPNTHRIQG